MGVLYQDHVFINDAISIRVPSVGDVIDDEDNFFAAVTSVISTPYDMMVQLDDAGIDFTEIDNFGLFCMMINNLRDGSGSILFGDLDFSKFEMAFNKKTNEVVLLDEENGLVIDRAVHEQMAVAVRKILQIKKNVKKPGNEEGKKYMLKIARMNQKRQRRLAKDKETTQLEDIIISLVNNREFPYNYETVRDISITQLYLSLNQVGHKINYDNIMRGYYAGTIKLEDIKHDERTWLRS